MTTTSIEWVGGEDGSRGRSWNPLRGCSLASDECQGCYAQDIARRFSGPGKPFEGLINAHGKWNGVMRQAPEHTLYEPLSWRTPSRVFVNSMTDLFHENAEDWWIDEIFAVMALSPQHQFIVLTKRAERMRQYCADGEGVLDRVRPYMTEIFDDRVDPLSRRSDDIRATALDEWPFPNVILGVSVGRKRFVSRIDELRATPAAIRMVSFEPLLEDLGNVDLGGIGWVIAGGESGPGARPMHPDWARSIRDQSVAAGVPFFFKQWGEWAPGENNDGLPTRTERTASWWNGAWDYGRLTPQASQEQHVDDEPDVYRLGKRHTGRTLDGRVWDEFPRPAA